VVTSTRRSRLERFWLSGPPPPWDRLLSAAAVAYRAGLGLRRVAYATGLRRTRALGRPVVAVGNLTLGGTGKTPLVELVARELGTRGRRVAILSRGYGRQAPGSLRVVADPTGIRATPAEAGDEPYLLARRLPGVPIVVGPDRYRAGVLALARFTPDVLLLDDGFQQMRLKKDVDVVVLDGRLPWGQRGLFPRGTLREPPSALARAHLILVTHATAPADPEHVTREVRRWAPRAPIAHADYEPEAVEDVRTGSVASPDTLRARPYLAFAGIAAPDRFLDTLSGLGVRPREAVTFADHHAYTPADVAALEARARAVGAEALLTTEKDAMRLGGLGTLPLLALRVRLRVRGDVAAWWGELERRVAW
jgi:tetraacyldisaccharide 4'-kinase